MLSLAESLQFILSLCLCFVILPGVMALLPPDKGKTNQKPQADDLQPPRGAVCLLMAGWVRHLRMKQLWVGLATHGFHLETPHF